MHTSVLRCVALGCLLILQAVLQLGSAYKDPQCAPGRDTIVHLFEWRWEDIALECARYLGPNNFCGVQVSPPNEHRVFVSTEAGDPTFRPWWERYQPVSYRLDSRSGTEQEFASMVAECNRHNVRIYVDAVVNHMAMVGGSGRGIAGSYYNAEREDFPGVPYAPRHFNGRAECPTDSLQIEDYRNAIQVRNCRLLGLVDLRTDTDYVQQNIAGYFNSLIRLGVAGFRIDAAKHMWPNHISGILARTEDLLPSVFGTGKRAFVYQEVIDIKDNGEPIKNAEYTPLARVTEFNYGRQLGEAFFGAANLSVLREFQPGQPDVYLVASNDALVFIDNHDNQRGHGGGSAGIITYRHRNLYEGATAFELIGDYGLPRLMSSYHWVQRIENGRDINDWVGPPSNDQGVTDRVPIQTDGQCGGNWVCEHRWPAIRRMVKVRSAIAAASPSPSMTWLDVPGSPQSIALARTGVAFYAASTTGVSSALLKTGLTAGVYCEVLSGEVNSTSNGCTGQSVTVRSDGMAEISLPTPEGQVAMVIYSGAKIG